MVNINVEVVGPTKAKDFQQESDDEDDDEDEEDE